jgi:hypothetical protein
VQEFKLITSALKIILLELLGRIIKIPSSLQGHSLICFGINLAHAQPLLTSRARLRLTLDLGHLPQVNFFLLGFTEARTPADVQEFIERFSSWPQDSLKQRVDIDSGSRWTIRDIGTFQVLRIDMSREFPAWLQDQFIEASDRVRTSTEIQRAIKLLGTNWMQLSRAALIKASGSFGAFFSLLAEIIEHPPTPTPDRYLRDILQQSSQPSQGSSSSASEPPSSPLEPAPKRMRAHRDSDSYHPSNDSGNESEHSRYGERVKAEPVTNACFYHFLEYVTENSRRVEDDGFRLEWALTQDSFHVQTLHSYFFFEERWRPRP